MSGFTVVLVGMVVVASCAPPAPVPGGGGDLTPPVLTAPSEIVVAADRIDGAQVAWSVTAFDAVDGEVSAECTPGPGGFSVGDTSVLCSASDAAGNVAEASFDVTVLPAPVLVDAGAEHSCAVSDEGKVWCWGRNSFGQLGDSTRTDSTVPVEVPGISGAVAVSTGVAHSCALMSDTTARCWGRNNFGQLGDTTQTDSLVPVVVSGLFGAVSISAGNFASCAALADGSGKCWGGGALGDPTITQWNVPLAVAGLSDAVSVDTSGRHSCAVRRSGTVACWGTGPRGELGTGAVGSSLVPVDVVDLSGVASLSLGSDHACALLVDGTVSCWGYNGDGKIGDGSTSDALAPVPVVDLGGAVAVDAGNRNTCAVVGAGEAKCWGANDGGQLGDGSAGPAGRSLVPTTVSNLTGVSSVAVGRGTVRSSQPYGSDDTHACAATTAGAVSCWGPNNRGQAGNGRSPGVPSSPSTVRDLTGATKVDAGAYHTCAVGGDSKAYCWGAGGSGQLGDGFDGTSSSPVVVAGLDDVVDVTASGHGQALPHSCARRADGSVWCWGGNNWGQLGNGSGGVMSLEAMQVDGITDAISVAAGSGFTCAVRALGEVQCWGSNQAGQLLGHPDNYSDTPVTIPGIGDAIVVSSGLSHSCAVVASGHVRCWGGGFTGEGATQPADVPDIDNAVSVSVGSVHSCARLASGSLRCWGGNGDGQLGDGTTTGSALPVEVVGVTDAIDVDASGSFYSPLGGINSSRSCAARDAGQVVCWGDLFSAPSQSVPTIVLGVDGALAVSSGLFHTCAVTAQGSVRCWGDDRAGQLGTGYWTRLPTPVIGFT